VMAVMAVAVVLMGVYPQPLIDTARRGLEGLQSLAPAAQAGPVQNTNFVVSGK
jgi:NADH:ubiquinone oxidoreductase subunit 4 (subunit M)